MSRATEGTYVFITNGSYSGKFGRIAASMRDNRFKVELVHHDGSCIYDESSHQKVNTNLRDTFFRVLHILRSDTSDNKINLNIALDSFKSASQHDSHLTANSSNLELDTPAEESKKIEVKNAHPKQSFLYIKNGEHTGSFGYTESAQLKLLTVDLVNNDGSSKTSSAQSLPIRVIVEIESVEFLEEVVIPSQSSSSSDVDLRASYMKQYRKLLSDATGSHVKKEHSDDAISQPEKNLEQQHLESTLSTDSGDADQGTLPRVRSHEFSGRIVLLTKGKFFGCFGKIVSSDEMRHRIYILNSDMSKGRRKPYDYLKSTCLLLQKSAQSASNLEDLEALLSPSELAHFQHLKRCRSAHPLQDTDVKSRTTGAPSKQPKNQGEQSRCVTELSLEAGAYAIISGGPWYGHFGQIQRLAGNGHSYLLHIVDRNGGHVLNQQKLYKLTAQVPWSQLIALSVASHNGQLSSVPDLDASLQSLGRRAAFLRNRRDAIEKHSQEKRWDDSGDNIHVLDKALDDIICKIESISASSRGSSSVASRDSATKAADKAQESHLNANQRKREPENNEGEKDLDLLFHEDVDLMPSEQAANLDSDPRSAKVYQPSPSQRKPALSQIRGLMASYQSRYDSEDSDDEARNNLYFVESAPQQASDADALSPFTGRFFCLCYNNRAKFDRGDVEVVPISLPFLEGWSNVGDRSNCPTVVMSVARNRLRPLDPPLVRKHCGSNVVAGEYLLALMCFADWDNYSASTFVWPWKIVALFTDASATNNLCRRAVSHPLRASPHGKSCLSKVILFLLCANHLGILDSFDEELFSSRGECSQEVVHLLTQLSAISVNDDENCVQRTASRVGADYQAALPALQSFEKEDSVSESTYRCYSYRECQVSKFDDKLMVKYLGSVQDIRERFLSPGHLVEIPRAVEAAAAHIKKYSEEPMKSCEPKYFDHAALNLGLLELRCVQQKSVTVFGFVKESKVDSTVTESSMKSIDESCESPSSAKTGSDEEVCSEDELSDSSASMVIVKLETHEVKVPSKLCRSFLLPVDYALDILYSSQFDLDLALQRVRQVQEELSTSIDDTVDGWTTDCFCAKEVAAFYLAFQRHRRNVRALWIAYNQLVSKIPRGKSKRSSSRKTEDISNTPGNARNMTLKRIFYLFTLFFVERDAVNNDPLPCPPVARKKQVDSTILSDGEKAKRSTVQRLSIAKVASAGQRPLGWPSSLPLSPHNIYFLKGRNAPCICIDVDVNKEDSIVVLQICTASYNNSQIVPVSAVEPFQEDQLQQCFDDRTAPFTLALIKFSAWELSSANTQIDIPADSHFRKWYIYPSFVIKMLSHLPLLTEWRKQAERAARNSKADRSIIYFNCLVEMYKNLNEYEITAGGRIEQKEYPWEAAYREKLLAEAEAEAEDAEHDEVEDVEDGEEEERGLANGVNCSNPAVAAEFPHTSNDNELRAAKRLRYDSKIPVAPFEGNSANYLSGGAQVRDSDDEAGISISGVKRSHSEDADSSSIDLTRPAAQRARVASNECSSHLKKTSVSLNLFWLDRSNLPCLYYDAKEKVAAEKILVQPICCSTYHYYVEVPRSLIEPLSLDNLKTCNDERTIEFAGSLIDFAKWHLSSIKEKASAKAFPEMLDPEGVGKERRHRHYVDVENKSGIVRYYIWPSRILNLVTKPKDFSAFRKEAERSKRSGGRRVQYLEALLKLYNDNGNGSDSGSEDDDEE